MAYHNDGIPCYMCKDGVLEEKGSKWENEAGEDDSTYLQCDKCGSLYNERGQLLKEGKDA